jgi:hypothetical protein
MPTPVILAAVAAFFTFATPASAQPGADMVKFAADAEKARGHLLVSEQLYAQAQARGGALHAAHPVQELGNRLIGPVRRVDAARADRLRETLKEPGRAIEARVPAAQYTATVARVASALDDAVTRVVGAEERAKPAFRARVLAALLDGVADEYDEAFKDGRITQVVEYQDAYGFFSRARALYDALPPSARRADAEMTSLAKALASREPPKEPMPARDLRALTRRIGRALSSP